MAGVFAQDDWEVRRGLTLNAGVRWDQDSLFQGDNNNFAPRVGFAWNVGGRREDGGPRQHRDLLRHARVVRDQPRVEHRPGRADHDRSAAGRSAVPDLPEPVQRVPDRRARRWRAPPSTCPMFQGADFPGSIGDEFPRVAPYFFNTNVGVQHELGPNWAMSADYTRVYGYDLLVTWDINAPPFFALGPGQTRTAAQANALRPLGVPNRTGGPYGIPFTGFRSLYLQFNGGHTGVQRVEARAEQAHVAATTRLQANYTLGRARGDVDNFRLNNSFVPGLTALDGDRGYQWGRATPTSPHVCSWRAAPTRRRAGIRVGGILFARSGFPYTASSAWTPTATACGIAPEMPSPPATATVPRA